MKKAYFTFWSILLLTLTIVSSCQKDNQEQLVQTNDPTLKNGSFNNDKHDCRLVADSGLSDGFLLTYHYNAKGLVDAYHMSKPDFYDFSGTFEYNSRKLMSKVKFTYGDGVFYDIVLTYDKNKLVRETWYAENTKDTVDYYINTYNKKGQLVRRDDPPYGFYDIFKYDIFGNLTSSELINYDGTLNFGEEYSYSGPIRNPFISVTGLPVSLIFVNDHIGGPNRFTGLKTYYNDENGNRVVDFNWESSETEIKTGPGNYPVYQNSRDVVSDTWTDQIFRYENCDCNSGWTHPKDRVSGRKANTVSPYSYRFENEIFRKKIQNMKQKSLNNK